jgi:uncharacterized protein YutE (UPF0331/DUF86 family)
MYNVNTVQIEEILTFIDQSILPCLEDVMSASKEEFEAVEPLTAFAAERMFHLFIEATTDIGNLLIDGFIMRDPGSYEDIVDIMEDERVFPEDSALAYKKIVQLRKRLIADYTMNHRQILYDVYHNTNDEMMAYTTYIRKYLQKELW